jgi:hypothetical protein
MLMNADSFQRKDAEAQRIFTTDEQTPMVVILRLSPLLRLWLLRERFLGSHQEVLTQAVLGFRQAQARHLR